MRILRLKEFIHDLTKAIYDYLDKAKISYQIWLPGTANSHSLGNHHSPEHFRSLQTRNGGVNPTTSSPSCSENGVG